MTDPDTSPLEVYRQAEQRLRRLLLGDGIDTVGRVTGEEHRAQVANDLRRMRKAFDAVLERQQDQASRPGASVYLEEELQRIASLKSRTHQARLDEVPTFVTPAEAAEALRMSVSAIYRAIRSGEIGAVRLTTGKRGALRIPTAELLRLSEESVALDRAPPEGSTHLP